MTRTIVTALFLICSIPGYAQREYYEYKNNGDYHVLEIDYDNSTFMYRAYTTLRGFDDPFYFPQGYLEIYGMIESVDTGLKLYKYDYIYMPFRQMNLARIKFFCLFIRTLCKVQNVCFEKLATGFGTEAQRESSLRRIQRFKHDLKPNKYTKYNQENHENG